MSSNLIPSAIDFLSVGSMDIAAVIPTRNRVALLEKCLVSLCEQTLAPERYEICAVDNGSTDNTKEIFAAVAARFPRHRLFMLDEPKAGVARARNRGFYGTTAPLVAMGDDDATMPPDWLERYTKRFAELGEDVVAMGGDIVPVWQAPKPAWLTPRMMGILSAAAETGNKPQFVEPPQNLIESNCCYRRAALESVGGFPNELGRVGTLLLSGEGSVNMVLHKKAGRLFYDPEIVIHHVIHANRLNPMWFRQRYFWQGISGYVAHRYYEKHGLNVMNAIQLSLPLKRGDWDFVREDTAVGLEDSTIKFESLGFVLAMSGIIQAEDGA